MTTLDLTATTVQMFGHGGLDEAELAAAAFLAQYTSRTLDAYRHDLLTFFRWANDLHLPVLEATRPRIELYRAALEERGLAASTIDRRLSTVCGFYRFAHIDGRVASNPARVRAVAWMTVSLGRSYSPQSASTTPTRRSAHCSASTACG